MSNTVVFAGSEEKLYALEGFTRPFTRENWTVEQCTSIELAQKVPNPNVLVVWATANLFVKDFKHWEKYPPTIWYCFSDVDIAPSGVLIVWPDTLPTQLFGIAQKLSS